MIRQWIAAFVFLGAALMTTSAAAQKGAAKSNASLDQTLPNIVQWELDNGLKVAFMEVRSAPVVTVQVWYHVGSKEEARDRRGSAHMFEHMMFKGTKHVRPEEHARHLNRVGGVVNAFTTEDVTAYHNTVPKQYLDFAVQLEAERMTNLLFRKKMVDTEREVVKEEIRQQENQPIQKGLLRFLELAFTKHPYAWTAGGTIKDLDQTTPADLENFYKTYYVPNNAMLVIVGDVGEKEARTSAQKWFGGIPKGAEPPRPASAATEPEQKKLRREVVEAGQVPIVISGYHIPSATHADIYAIEVLSLILSGGESSRLHKRLVRTDKSAVFAGGQPFLREHPGMYLVFAVFKPGQGDKAEKALDDEVAKLAKFPPTARELKKAKNQIAAGFVFGLEGVRGLAQQIGMSWIQSGDPTRFVKDLEKYRAVTAKDVQRVAKRYLKPAHQTVVVVPAKSGGAK
jgi:zinc protease